MKEIAFNYAQQAWDRYNAFYNNLNGGLFTHFSTGEFMGMKANPDPDPTERKVYEQYGVALTASDDGLFDFYTPSPDGLKLPRAWVHYDTLEEAKQVAEACVAMEYSYYLDK